MVNQTIPGQAPVPNSNEYGGDEVSAIVLDPGYSGVRAGFAGLDAPYITPTHYRAGPEPGEVRFGDNALHNYASGWEVRNPMSTDGQVQDWDLATNLWEYALTDRLIGKRTKPIRTGVTAAAAAAEGDGDGDGDGENKDDGDVDMDAAVEAVPDQEAPLLESPLLMSEPGLNPTKEREKTIEIAMETWGAPAFWLGRTGVLSAFSAGRSASALVIDVGASITTVTPVVDGLALKKSTFKSPLAGNFVSQQCRYSFAHSTPPVTITPHFMVKSKRHVEPGSAADAVLRTFDNQVHPSFRRLEEERVLTEFKESVVQVWDGPQKFPGVGQNGLVMTEPADSQRNAGRLFEMPDGSNKVYRAERYSVVEGLFDSTAILSDGSYSYSQSQTIPGLVDAAIGSLTGTLPDSVSNVLSSIVVVGGSSLLVGLTKRVDIEISAKYPSPRSRIFAPSNTIERRCSAWLGGSILASLGAFHQMWISKKEYEENGASFIDKRCK